MTMQRLLSLSACMSVRTLSCCPIRQSNGLMVPMLVSQKQNL